MCKAIMLAAIGNIRNEYDITFALKEELEN